MNEKKKVHQLNQLYLAMIHFDAGDPMRIQHFTKVHSYARLMAQEEGMDPEAAFILEAAAIVHDIGIHVAEQKYGYQNGKLQEQEGPAAARKLMQPLGFTEEEMKRVEFLVGHHHTYKNINALDYQILVEADFIVNLCENGKKYGTALTVRKNIFKTQTGIRILDDMFGIDDLNS